MSDGLSIAIRLALAVALATNALGMRKTGVAHTLIADIDSDKRPRTFRFWLCCTAAIALLLAYSAISDAVAVLG